MKIRYFISAALLVVSASATAQYLNMGYFTDGYLYRHDQNPAFGNAQNYVSMPALGNLNFDMRGDLSAKSVLYNVDGRTTTLLNSKVKLDEVLANIQDDNKTIENLKVQLLGAGFKAFGGYNTIEVNVRAFSGANVPGSLFRLAKEGLTNQTYQLGGLKAQANSYAEVALGHSHQINDHLRIGAKLKLLLGIAALDADIRQATLNLNNDAYTANVDGELNVNISDLAYTYKRNEGNNRDYINGIDKATPGVAGLGAAVDLGIDYQINDSWRVSAALLDLGMISYSKTYRAANDPSSTFNTSKYIFSFDEDADNSFENTGDQLVDDLNALYQLQNKGDQGATTRNLGATVNVGAQFTLPNYTPLSFGALATARLQGDYSWTEFRFSANVAPVSIVSAGLSAAIHDYGFGFGFIVDFHPRGFNLFVASDNCLFTVAKQGVPLDPCANLSMGINFPF